jgi:hypothetical protein
MSRAKQTSPDALKRKRDENENTVTQATKKTATSPSLPEDGDEKHNTTSDPTKNAQRSSKMEDVNEAIGHMDNSLLADHFAKQ